MRSAGVSTLPNIIVAELRSPASCTLRCTSSQRSVVVFFGAMISRTRSTRISAPGARHAAHARFGEVGDDRPRPAACRACEK